MNIKKLNLPKGKEYLLIFNDFDQFYQTGSIGYRVDGATEYYITIWKNGSFTWCHNFSCGNCSVICAKKKKEMIKIKDINTFLRTKKLERILK